MGEFRGYRVRVGPLRLRLSAHAVERYGERVRPGLDTPQLIEELKRILPGARYGMERPEWAAHRVDACGWVMLTDEIAFPVAEDVLVTCVDRGGVGATVRVIRKESREGRRDTAPARGRRKKHGKVARAERRRAQVMREAADG